MSNLGDSFSQRQKTELHRVALNIVATRAIKDALICIEGNNLMRAELKLSALFGIKNAIRSL